MKLAKKWIQGAVSHPGRLTNAAKKAGVSKREMAEKWSHSKDASKRGAGNLGLRFMKGGDIHAGGNTDLPKSHPKLQALNGARKSNMNTKKEFVS